MDKEEEARKNMFGDELAKNERWVVMKSCDDQDDICDEEDSSRISMESSPEDDSINSIASSSSSDMVEDASSSSSSSSKSCSSSSSSSSSPFSPNSTLSNGPLYDLSELMVHLPLRRGLSRYYEGKSQSFTSLASVKSLEDLPKKVSFPVRKKLMKPCKSYGGGLECGAQKLHHPKGVISKKSLRGGSNFLSSLGNFSPNSVSVQKNFF